MLNILVRVEARRKLESLAAPPAAPAPKMGGSLVAAEGVCGPEKQGMAQGEKKKPKQKRDCWTRYPPQHCSEGFARQDPPAPAQCIFSPAPGVTRMLDPAEKTGVSHPKAPAFESLGKRE